MQTNLETTATIEEGEEKDYDNLPTQELLRQHLNDPAEIGRDGGSTTMSLRKRIKKSGKKRRDGQSTTKFLPTLRCKVCRKTFREKHKYTSHIKIHSSETHKCIICQREFNCKKYLQRHVRNIHDEDKRMKYKCTVCDMSFPYNARREIHMRVHTGEKPYKCEVCGKSFSARYSFQTHKLTHTDEKPFKCVFCPYACRDTSTLRKHQERHMGIIKLYQCKKCDKIYKSRKSLKIHVADFHMQVETLQFECDVCHKRFKHQRQLYNHKTYNHKKKEGNCEICGKYFRNMRNIASHMMTHSDLRPWRCGFEGCLKRFKTKSDVNKHKIIHFPEQQFECEHCGARFARKHRLVEHLQGAHGGGAGERRPRRRMKSEQPASADQIEIKLEPVEFEEHDLSDVLSKAEVVDAEDISVAFNQDTLYSDKVLSEDVERIMSTDSAEESRSEPEKTLAEIFAKEIRRKSRKKHKNKELVAKNAFVHIPEDIARTNTIEITVDPQESSANRETGTKLTARTWEVAVSSPAKDVIPEETAENSEATAETSDAAAKISEPTAGTSDAAAEISEAAAGTSVGTAGTFEAAAGTSEATAGTIVSEASTEPQTLTNEMFNEIYAKQITTNVKKKSLASQIDSEKLKEVKKDIAKKLKLQRKKAEVKILERTRLEYNQRIRAIMAARQTIRQEAKPVENVKIIVLNKQNNTKDTLHNKEGDDNSIANDSQGNSLANDSQVNNCQENNPDTNSQENNNELEALDIETEEPTNYDATSEDDAVDNENTFKKIKFNTDQCYVCFKLFESKEKLLDHCQEHFDVCSDRILKKCPLCPYVTSISLYKHILMVHKVKIKTKYGRLIRKDTENERYAMEIGGKQYFEVNEDNNKEINEIEVIPSVKSLNKKAAMEIDRKNRELKAKETIKSSLVRKGKEWVVCHEKVNLNFKDYIVPEFDEIRLQRFVFSTDNKEDDGYIEKMIKLKVIVKKHGYKMLAPCDLCEKVCLNIAALKAHRKAHEVKPPKIRKRKKKNSKKSAKNKIKNRKSNISKKKSQLAEANEPEDPNKNLKDFYKNNIKGTDEEFEQFLKIFKQIDRSKDGVSNVESDVEHDNDTDDSNDKDFVPSATKKRRRRNDNVNKLSRRKIEMKINIREKLAKE